MTAYCPTCRESENVKEAKALGRSKKERSVTVQFVYECGATSRNVTSERLWREYLQEAA